MRAAYRLTVLVFLLAARAEAQEGPGDGCVTAVPEPLLASESYPDHSFVPSKDHGAIERASLDLGTRLEIRHAGCADLIRKDFVFSLSRPGLLLEDRDGWVRWARQALAALKTTELGASWVGRLSSFLGKAKLPKSGRLEVCADGEAPTSNGCAGMGGDVLEVKPVGKGVTVKVANYRFL